MCFQSDTHATNDTRIDSLAPFVSWNFIRIMFQRQKEAWYYKFRARYIEQHNRAFNYNFAGACVWMVGTCGWPVWIRLFFFDLSTSLFPPPL